MVQFSIFVCSGIAAFLLRFEFEIPPAQLANLLAATAVWAVAKPAVFHLLRLDRGWWRFVSIPDVIRVAAGNVLASLLGLAPILLLAPVPFPRSVLFLDFLICLLATMGIRVGSRIMDEALRARCAVERESTIIYGAGEAGVMLLREIRSNLNLGYTVVGFVDDDPAKNGSRIFGIPVLGRGLDLADVARTMRVRKILIAMPSAAGDRMASALRHCHSSGIPCKTVPGLSEVIQGRELARQIRDVAVEDLLGRQPVRLDTQQISEMLAGKTVMVTGAGGSIGSELCRQIARFAPRAIVGYDIAETALFHVEQQMSERFSGVRFVPEIGNIQNRERLAEVLARYSPSILYHAAAYKHVPLMESHLFEAVENNILGTWNVAIAAGQAGVERFVMISSDKAVRPTSVMGVTKRVAELVVNSLQNGSTRYVSVRFGNVLGSNGSVVPTFKKQIAAGGPVTVTHPDMRRYFMLIPEAAQLVIQASAMGMGGEVFVLDMGEPVKIVDLATNLILLSNLRPNEDIRIDFTGPRPGEKLFEELNRDAETTAPTCHEKINSLVDLASGLDEMDAHLGAIRRLCATRNRARLLRVLNALVPEYSPSPHALRLVPGDSETAAASGLPSGRGLAELAAAILSSADLAASRQQR
jgi:FlaA1/EpsC-like NDP-sugar epimerase